jgi:hypothetical protein
VERDLLSEVSAILLAELRIESEDAAAEAHCGVMLLEPWHAENDIVGGWRNVQAQSFFIAGGVEDERVIMGDESCLGWTPIGED